jgi:hypothetical protein
VYVEHGSSVEEGVKTSFAPRAVHLPATCGLIVGSADPGTSEAEKPTCMRTVPSGISLGGMCTMRVCASTLGVGGGSLAGGCVGLEGDEGSAGVALVGDAGPSSALAWLGAPNEATMPSAASAASQLARERIAIERGWRSKIAS